MVEPTGSGPAAGLCKPALAIQAKWGNVITPPRQTADAVSASPGAASERTLFGHPIGLSVLFGTEMWERFCYYGMRALLTLYMVQFLLVNDHPQMVLGYGAVKSGLEWLYGPLRPQPLAALIYGLYTFGTYVSCLLGGYVADSLLGQRRAVILGAVIMAAGEFMLVDPHLFFVGLIVLVGGNGFFKPNISTQVGGLYRPGDQRIDTAYSIFYVGINLGALIAPLVCSRVVHFGDGPAHWNYGFAAAGVGMLIGLAHQYCRPARAAARCAQAAQGLRPGQGAAHHPGQARRGGAVRGGVLQPVLLGLLRTAGHIHRPDGGGPHQADDVAHYDARRGRAELQPVLHLYADAGHHRVLGVAGKARRGAEPGC